MVLEGAMYATGVKNLTTNITHKGTLWATIMTGLEKHDHWYNSERNIMGATSTFLHI